MKKYIKRLTFLGVLMIVLILSANYLVVAFAKNKTFSEVDTIPTNRVGLLLGTSKNIRNGHVNLYFAYRVNAAVELFEKGKIEYILVSGDNRKKGVDEPNDFKDALIDKGIPEDRIILDFAGFRTLDSVVRAKRVFGQETVTIISQKFHNERAIYLAEHKGLKAIGYNAKGVSLRYGFKVVLREYLARVKVFIDLLLGIQPKFLGEPVTIG